MVSQVQRSIENSGIERVLFIQCEVASPVLSILEDFPLRAPDFPSLSSPPVCCLRSSPVVMPSACCTPFPQSSHLNLCHPKWRTRRSWRTAKAMLEPLSVACKQGPAMPFPAVAHAITGGRPYPANCPAVWHKPYCVTCTSQIQAVAEA